MLEDRCRRAFLFVIFRYQPEILDANGKLPVDGSGKLITNPTHQPGAPGDIVVVRLMYQPVWVSLLGLNELSNMSQSSRLLMATAAFRNEPYQ